MTADLHLGHDRIRLYTNRPHLTVQEMDIDLINRWNSVVGHNDTIYVLGDFTLSGIKTMELYLEALHGQVRIIPGSHDYRWLKDWKDTDRVKMLPPLVTLELPQYGTKEHPMLLTLCHYCLRTWPSSHFNSWSLFAHSHGTLQGTGKQFDCGIDCFNYTPISLEKVAEIMATRPNNENYIGEKREQ